MKDLAGQTNTLVFFVNGVKVVDNEVDPEWTLLFYLRNKLRLCGTKLGCAEGGCGACTVMVSKYDRKHQKIVHYAVNACLAPVCSMHGLSVTTVEGIGSTRTRLHPVQERIAKSHGSQCGFCTPGIVMSMYSLLRSLPGKPTMDDLEVAFQGNLCRCTGYRPIIEGYKTFTEEWEQKQRLQNGNGACAMGENCCKKQNGVSNGVNGCPASDDKLFDSSTFKPVDPSQEPIFPPELQVSRVLDEQYLIVKGPRATWYRPTNLDELLTLKTKYPQAKIINGNTEVGVEVKFKNFVYPVLILPNQVGELTSIREQEWGVSVGAAVTLTDMETALKHQIQTQPKFKTRIYQEIVDMLHWFAGKQIRNVGAVGGNIMTGSPISDLNPIFMAAGCTLELNSKAGGSRTVCMDKNFWTGYRKNIVAQDELLISINIPYTKNNQYFKAYKQAKRRDDDIAIVNSAFNLTLNNNKIEKLCLCYGGMAPTTVMAHQTASQLLSREWSNEMLNEAYKLLLDELPLDPGAPGGMITFRRSLTLSMFFKFYLEVGQALESEGTKLDIPDSYKSGKDGFHTLTPKSSQYFTKVPNSQEKHDMVGRPKVHQSAFKQAAGEAVYLDDIPRQEKELYMTLVVSSRAHAKIVSIDASAALAVPGVVDFLSSKDLPRERNKAGPIVHDEEIFASEKVVCVGQVIGAILAQDQQTSQRASKLVEIIYEDIKPLIITIEDAIKEKSYFDDVRSIRFGDAESAIKSCEHVLEGEVRIGGQEHFYFETQAALAIPKKEDNELEVWSSSQHPSELQHLIGEALGVAANRVVCKVKRIGGGFGGKESKSAITALPAAIAAHKLNRPVRIMLDRDEDMISTGQRHPFLGRYQIGFSKTGKLTACIISIYNNAGCTLDLSSAVLERAMFHFENAVKIPHVTVHGYVCKTNLPSNTAFRGFGGPQGMLMGETMYRHVAEFLNKDYMEILELNMYRENDLTHFNQPLEHCTAQRCWSECLEDSKYYERKQKIDLFNKSNRWKKRGIAVVPTKFGISFTTTFLNQAGALVIVYQDGSVLISHGGTEMGQGLHTKMIQVASRALGISQEYIHISETSTDKVPNTSATAASAGSDLNGMAILNACNELNERLKPIKEANPKGEWKDWIKAAYFARVSLAVSGFYKTPNINYDMKTNSGNAFNYFTYGTSVSEVEIDCLTGDHQVIRTDIVMDLGESLNPAIDIGQIEGAFVQGQGMFTIEDPIFSPEGVLYSRGPGAYKIPGFSDIPAEFNVSLLKGAPNPRAVYSSKAVGEPPLFLASSIFFAIREAVKAARKESNINDWFTFNSPATAAAIRMACQDQITQMVPVAQEGTFKPWNITV